MAFGRPGHGVQQLMPTEVAPASGADRSTPHTPTTHCTRGDGSLAALNTPLEECLFQALPS